MKYLFLLFLSLTILSCQEQQIQELPDSPVIAVVGEEKITADLLAAFLQANGIANADENTINRVMDQLITEVAMANIAKKKKLTLSGSQLNTLKYLQLKTLANVAQQDYLQTHKITEEEIIAEYNKVKQQVGNVQFHVRHILFNDEVQAIKELEKINSPADYLQYEADYIKNNPNIKNIGNLGWVNLGQLPESFREIIPGVADNTLLTEVVNSRFGAHIVYVQGTRNLQPPKLEDVKAGILKTLEAKKIAKFSQLAKAKAHVIVHEK
ncbi:MAG: peptidyl-prolyl cis-trans isomerase [Proteobacteria bacterium]|nr:peptidyl-prolyl cis-trans isomerase [Pseudomonadota bacterium]